jgi:hypothetical protein
MPAATTSLRTVNATRYVTPLREGGSLPGLMEADDDGMYVAKFTGAGQGRKALVAEVIVGETARTLGLLIPELVGIEIDPALGAAEPDPEIQELITASGGLNLGVDFLPSALPYAPGAGFTPSPETAADIVWLDALTTNVDRTPRNPNLLVWHGRLWLIDHGAALYLQHGGLRDELAQRPFPLIAEHVLLSHAAPLGQAGERLRERVDLERAIAESTALVPPQWFEGGDPPDAYAEYLLARLRWGGFEQEAERARAALA